MIQFRLLGLALLFFCHAELHARENFLELRARGDSAFAVGDWATYQDVYEKLTTETPENGTYWSRLYEAHYRQGNYEAAINAALRAVQLGHRVSTNQYNIASAYALLGRAEEAVDHYLEARAHKLRNAEQVLSGDSDWQALLQRPEIRARIYPELEAGASREDRWRTDIDFLSMRAEETHYDLYAQIDREEWQSEIDRIKSKVDKWTDLQIRAALSALIVRIGDGHSLLYPRFAGPEADALLPIGFYRFSDGVFVTQAGPDHQDLIGARLLAIEEKPVEIVFDAVAPFISRDNDMSLLWISTQSLSFTWVLSYAGIVHDPGTVEMTFEQNGKQFQRNIVSAPFTAKTYEACCRRLRDARARTLWMAAHDKPYHAEFQEQAKLFYLRYNQVVSNKELPLEAYLDSLAESVRELGAETFVLDLRQNAGGNGTLNPMTIRHLLRIEAELPPNRFFVLIGRNTFSAAMVLASLISQYTDALFIGEPTGSSPNFTGENDIVTLPNTKMMVSLSSRRWLGSVSEDERIWLAPDVAVSLTSEAFFNGRDPVMEVVYELAGLTE